MAKKIVVDPLTRIEGHLRIEAVVENGVIKDAWSSSTMWRGIEQILQGRDPRELWYWTQRFCGVCTTVHSIASVRAVEDALDIVPPLNAELIRNIIIGIQAVQDHVIHFYHLHALDWVDITSALEADPAKTAALAKGVSKKYAVDVLGNRPYAKNSEQYFETIKQRVAAFVGTKRLGPFANAYWGHKAYKLPAEANLMAVAHYLEALDWQREVIKIHALLGSKNPHPQTFLVGGMAIPIDTNSQNAINADMLAHIKELLVSAKNFVEQVYVPDLLAVASFYKEWGSYGGGDGAFDFISFGDFPTTTGARFHDRGLWLKPGRVTVADFPTLHEVKAEDITEYVTHSWYSYKDGDDKGLNPLSGETTQNYTGPSPGEGKYDYLDTDGKYSWVKAPRYLDRPAEVGPLARCLVAYANGQPEYKAVVDLVLGDLNIPATALFSTLGRTAARGIETLIYAAKNLEWLDMLIANIKTGDIRIHAGEKWDPSTWPKEARGVGFHEAPRGTLSHWVNIRDTKIANFQAVVPSTWNASPRDAKKQRGPYESALIGTPIADAEKPIEILRTIHSYDPCLACAVHLLDEEGNEVSRVKVL
ncbi:MAG: hydrogenase 2 large subunit [Deltaproteobacteria bacterium]|nr:MAG: hydrogenase 2 large subunit [Deltaproteobacteria bacterium]